MGVNLNQLKSYAEAGVSIIKIALAAIPRFLQSLQKLTNMATCCCSERFPLRTPCPNILLANDRILHQLLLTSRRYVVVMTVLLYKTATTCCNPVNCITVSANCAVTCRHLQPTSPHSFQLSQTNTREGCSAFLATQSSQACTLVLQDLDAPLG